MNDIKMKIEIECKLHLDNPGSVKSKLHEIGADDKGEVFEKNWVFDKNSTLAEARTLLRLRMHNNESSGIVTHKTPAKEGKFKSKKETETRVENAANMRHIFESLGYQVTWYYEKKRHSFYLDQMTIVLDTTPELGVFIEIEGSNDEEIESLINKLDLDINDNIMVSYPVIWREHCQKSGKAFCNWKFCN